MSSTLPDETRIGRVTLCVADLEWMREFYETVIGLRVLERDAEPAKLGTGSTAVLVLAQAAAVDIITGPRHVFRRQG
jgi:catechol 2,3-dioxygenase